jgi:hypothetical protein
VRGCPDCTNGFHDHPLAGNWQPQDRIPRMTSRQKAVALLEAGIAKRKAVHLGGLPSCLRP